MTTVGSSRRIANQSVGREGMNDGFDPLI
jgi:hypothetical protein